MRDAGDFDQGCVRPLARRQRRILPGRCRIEFTAEDQGWKFPRRDAFNPQTGR
jgi:hypothetical protein